MEKESKELKALIKAINDYYKKHNGNVQFFGSFLAFEGEDCEIVDDRIFAYGDKKTLLIGLTEIIKQIKKEKDFVNW